MASLVAFGSVACSGSGSGSKSSSTAIASTNSKSTACHQLGADIKTTGNAVTAVGKELSAGGEPDVKPLQEGDDNLHLLVTSNPGAFAAKVGPLADVLGRLIIDIQGAPSKIAGDVKQFTPALNSAASYCKITLGPT
jgi:hypothetical protein